MLPFSALAAKELVPIGTRPAIQWVLEEAVQAGISGAVVVLSPHKRSLRSFLEGYQRTAYADFEESRKWQALLERNRRGWATPCCGGATWPTTATAGT